MVATRRWLGSCRAASRDHAGFRRIDDDSVHPKESKNFLVEFGARNEPPPGAERPAGAGAHRWIVQYFRVLAFFAERCHRVRPGTRFFVGVFT